MTALEHTRRLEHRSGRNRGPGAHPPGPFARLRAARARRDYEASILAFAASLKATFREACTGIALCQYVHVASGVTIHTPRVGEVRLGPPTSFTVELMAGQEPADFTKGENGARLAHTLGAHAVRVEPIAGRWVRLHLLDADPLRDGFGLPPVTVASGAEPVILGRTEDATTLGHALTDPAHLAVQGMNGSGKSVFTYGLLAQLAAASDVLVTGSDITGLLLGRAWDCCSPPRKRPSCSRSAAARAAGQLYVGPAKSDASEAAIPLPKVTRRVLEEHRRRQDEERASASRWEDHDLVFPSTIGTPREPRNLNRHFAELRERVGMPDVRLHDLRHTVVSLLLDLGTPPHVVQAIARHAHIDVTMAIYAHTNLDAMRQALDAIEWEDL